MTPTRGTDERFVIRTIIDNRWRGWSLMKGIFAGSIVTDDDLTRVYCGVPIADEKMAVIKKVLAERMPRE